MKPTELIKMARIATYDTALGQQTWEDKQYLAALNDGRAFLYTRFPEARVTAVVGLTAYAEIEEKNIAVTMTEDDVYRAFFIEWMVYRFFGAGSRDTANAQKAQDHKKDAMLALSSLTGGR